MGRTDGSHWFYSYLPMGISGGATSTLIPLFAYALGGWGGLARHGPRFGRRRIDFDEVPVRDRRRARILRGPRGATRDARGRNSRGPQGRPPGRCPSARRAGTLPPDAHRSLRGTT